MSPPSPPGIPAFHRPLVFRVECSENAFSGIKVLHLLATSEGWWRLKILTTRTYLISWEFIFLLKFGFLVQLFSFCPIILLIETSSVLGNNCFVTPIKNNSSTQKHFRRPLHLRIWTEIKHSICLHFAKVAQTPMRSLNRWIDK